MCLYVKGPSGILIFLVMFKSCFISRRISGNNRSSLYVTLCLQKLPGMKEEEEPEEEEEEELGHAETYAEYMPMKRKCCVGRV